MSYLKWNILRLATSFQWSLSIFALPSADKLCLFFNSLYSYDWMLKRVSIGFLCHIPDLLNFSFGLRHFLVQWLFLTYFLIISPKSVFVVVFSSSSSLREYLLLIAASLSILRLSLLNALLLKQYASCFFIK